jgi:hypothetical protein
MGFPAIRHKIQPGSPETTNEHATLCPRNNQTMHALLIMISTVPPPDACRSYRHEVEAAREDHHIVFGSYSQLLVVLFEKMH